MTAPDRAVMIHAANTWLFVCTNRHMQDLIMQHCRISRGRSHGASSAWQPSYWDDPQQGYRRQPAVMVRDQKLAFELMISFV